MDLREKMLKFLNERLEQDGQVIHYLMLQYQEVEYPDPKSPLKVVKEKREEGITKVYASGLGFINTFIVQEGGTPIKAIKDDRGNLLGFK